MSDLFHEGIPFDYVQRVFEVMAAAPQHTFQILTKRHERLSELAPDLPWPVNVWMGVSIENRRFIKRADHLREVPAAVRFISAEPLLGPLEGLDLHGIDWLIAGGESGPGHRTVRGEWIHELRDRCVAENVAFFFKQWGGREQRPAAANSTAAPGTAPPTPTATASPTWPPYSASHPPGSVTWPQERPCNYLGRRGVSGGRTGDCRIDVRGRRWAFSWLCATDRGRARPCSESLCDRPCGAESEGHGRDRRGGLRCRLACRRVQR